MALGIGALLGASAVTALISGLLSAHNTAAANRANTENTKLANEANIELQQQANTASAAEAQKNRDFQLEMSNTAHQREVSDLKAAGLNPWLSASGNGAAVTGGSTAVQGAASNEAARVQPLGDFGLGSASSALQSLAFLAALGATGEAASKSTGYKRGSKMVFNKYKKEDNDWTQLLKDLAN